MSLKITGGDLKGRNLRSLPSCKARPTTSMLRQALFNILQNQIEGSLFLDLFAGSGIMGIEALSRGARGAVFVEKELKTAKKIVENLKELKLEDQGKVICRPVLKALGSINIDGFYNVTLKGEEKENKKNKAKVTESEEVEKSKVGKEGFDLVYADAPYSFFEKKDEGFLFLEGLLQALKTNKLINEQGIAFIEAPAAFKKHLVGFELSGWELKELRQYGSSLLAIFNS